jgi:hypothetical protein
MQNYVTIVIVTLAVLGLGWRLWRVLSATGGTGKGCAGGCGCGSTTPQTPTAKTPPTQIVFTDDLTRRAKEIARHS